MLSLRQSYSTELIMAHRTLYALLIGGMLLLSPSRSYSRHAYQLEGRQNTGAVASVGLEPGLSLDYFVEASVFGVEIRASLRFSGHPKPHVVVKDATGEH